MSIRHGYWMPVFGGWLRNVDDEGMEASWNYVSKLARRSVSSSVIGSVVMRGCLLLRLGDDRNGLFRTRTDRLGRLRLEVNRDLAVDSGRVAVNVVQLEEVRGDHEAEGVALALLWVYVHLHVGFPSLVIRTVADGCYR